MRRSARIRYKALITGVATVRNAVVGDVGGYE